MEGAVMAASRYGICDLTTYTDLSTITQTLISQVVK